MQCREQGAECREECVECREQGVECREQGVECREQGVECREQGVECREQGVECREQNAVQNESVTYRHPGSWGCCPLYCLHSTGPASSPVSTTRVCRSSACLRESGSPPWGLIGGFNTHLPYNTFGFNTCGAG